MNEPTIIQRMAAWAHGLTPADVPERVREKARLQLFSVLGAIHASYRHELGRTVLEAVADWAGPGPATIIPTGQKVDLLSAVYANAALSIALDFDDYLLFGHTGHGAVAASLAVAEWKQRTVQDQLLAQIVANEIAGRIGASVVIGPHNGQAWSFIHLAGAAAATAKLLGLDADRTAHAIAISLYQPTYVLFPGFMGPDSKATTAANPAIIGVQAAILAAKGATGPLDVIEHPQGFLARFAHAPAPFFYSGYGKAWTTDTLAYKIYPGCAYIDTTVDAVLALRQDFRDEQGRALDPAEVAEVLVEGSLLTIEMDHLSKVGGAFDPLSPVSINFSIPGNVAIVLLKGRLRADDLRREELDKNADQIVAISDKVKLVHDWSLTTRMLDAMDRVIQTRQMLAELKIKDLISARFKMRQQYKSSIDLSLGDLKQLWRQAPEARQKIRASIIDAASAALKGKRGTAAAGYDLGSRRLEDFTMPFAARVTLKTKTGLIMTRLQEIPWGGPGHPLDKTRDFVINKYREEAKGNLPDDKVETLIEASPKLEERVTVDRLVALCCRAP